MKRGYDGEIEWATPSYKIYNTSINFKEGNNWGNDEGSSTTKEFHVCPNCFEFTVAPLLKEHLDIEPIEVKKDW